MHGRILLLAAAFVAMTGCTAKAPDTAADEAAIRAAAPLWFVHYNKGEVDSVANLYAEDGIVQAPGAPAAVGRAAIREYLANDIAATKAGGITLNGGEVTGGGASGDLGWVSGAFTATDSAGTTVDAGKYLSVYRRIDGKWLMIRDTWNSDKAPAAAAPPAAPAPATN